MHQPNYQALVKKLVSPDVADQMAAKMILIALDEDAINPLVDEYYAGITDAEGIAILGVLADIGGYEALAVLRNVFDFEEVRPALRYAAAQGLLRNSDKLTLEENQEITLYLAEQG